MRPYLAPESWWRDRTGNRKAGNRTGTDGAAFVRDALERVRVLPGVAAAGVGSGLPPRGLPFQVFIRRRTATVDEGVRMSTVFATPGFLEALGTPLVVGSPLAEADGERAVALVSESAARFYAADGDLAGRELPYRLPPIVPFDGPPRVAGVVRDVKHHGLDAPAAAAFYVPWSARPQPTGYLVVRAAGDPMALAPAVRRVLRELDPELPIPPIRSLADEMALSIADRRLRVVPALGFAAGGAGGGAHRRRRAAGACRGRAPARAGDPDGARRLAVGYHRPDDSRRRLPRRRDVG